MQKNWLWKIVIDGNVGTENEVKFKLLLNDRIALQTIFVIKNQSLLKPSFLTQLLYRFEVCIQTQFKIKK